MELTEKQLAEYKRILVRTLQVFDKFCTDHNLRYFAMGGTAIGAVRHKGIIPWDDDIDVAMIREDYDRLISLRNELKDTKYEIVDPSNPGYYLSYAKFIDKTTTLWEVEQYEFVIGVFIDVFPLNHVEDNIERIKDYQKEYLNVCNCHFYGYQNLLCKCNLKLLSLLHPRGIRYWLYLLNLKIRKKYYNRKFWEYDAQLKASKGNRLLNYDTQYAMEKELFKSEWFEKQIRVPFEDTEICLMGGYDEYLTQMFGDYMTLPPVEQRISHHYHYFLDLDRRWSLNEIKSYLRNV